MKSSLEPGGPMLSYCEVSGEETEKKLAFYFYESKDNPFNNHWAARYFMFGVRYRVNAECKMPSPESSIPSVWCCAKVSENKNISSAPTQTTEGSQ